MYYLDPSIFLSLTILVSCPFPYPVWYLGQYLILLFLVLFLLFSLKGLSKLSLDLIHFQIAVFASCIRCVTLNHAHIHPNTPLNTRIIIFVEAINMIMYVVSVVIRYGRTWALAMMTFIMYIIILSHRHLNPSGSNSWYSYPLI